MWISKDSQCPNNKPVTSSIFIQYVYVHFLYLFLGGYALYHSADIPQTKTIAKTVLKTPYFNITLFEVCLKFSYHMYGSNVKRLIIYVERTTAHLDYIWHSSYQQSDRWYDTQVTVRNFSGRLHFEATYGFGSLGDIALDNIAIEHGDCVDNG